MVSTQQAPAPTAEAPAATEEEKAAALRRVFPGWCIWWGRATGEWLAVKPSWVKLHCGLVCDKTVDGLAAKIAWIMRPVTPRPPQVQAVRAAREGRRA